MVCNSILARSFRKHEQKKLGYGTLVGCLLIAFSFCIMLKPHGGGSFLVLNLQILPRVSGVKLLMINDEKNSTQQLHEVADKVITKPKAICSLMKRTDFCDIEVNVRIHGASSSVYFASTDIEEISKANKTWKIKPYARKGEQLAMSRTREWSIKAVKTPQKMPKCTTNHSVPAILFPSGGYSGHQFYDFTDMLIPPLFITAREFNAQVQFVITDRNPWWVLKYKKLLSKLSNYDIIYIDNETKVHCFPQAIVGLKRDENELGINPKNHPYSIRDFREFLRSSYSLKRARANKNRKRESGKRPQLLIIARRKTRSFTNTREIKKMARKLGFKVIFIEPDMSMKKVAKVVNSCDVMMGVHGAGLANMVFLPENAVLIQIVPFGGKVIETVSRDFFADPSKGMDLKYLEYKVSLEESSLIQQYPKDDVVLSNPHAIEKQGWNVFKSIYLVKQNVSIDVNRFSPILLKAFELLYQ